MSYIVLWMDTDEAKFFKFTPGEVKKDHLKIGSHEAKAAHDKDLHTEPHHFYKGIADKVKDATEILLVGPGMAKTHFANHLEKGGFKEIKKKIVSIENMDHPTDNQIVAHARKFFRAHDLFT